MALMGGAFQASEFGPAVSTVGALLGRVAEVRRRWSLDLEEALLYLCIGYLNTERSLRMGSHGFVAATNISSVANFIGMPKETARRKINKLIDGGLVLNVGGIVIADIERWVAIAGGPREKGGQPPAP